jgi:hypothetical protein
MEGILFFFASPKYWCFDFGGDHVQIKWDLRNVVRCFHQTKYSLKANWRELHTRSVPGSIFVLGRRLTSCLCVVSSTYATSYSIWYLLWRISRLRMALLWATRCILAQLKPEIAISSLIYSAVTTSGTLLYVGHRLILFFSHSISNRRGLGRGGTRWLSWLRHCAASRKFAGSIPDSMIGIFHWRNPSGRTMALGPTHPLNRNVFWGVKAASA